jgi:hypothetical protein
LEAITGYETVLGDDHPRCQVLGENLIAPDTEVENNILIDTEDPEGSVAGQILSLI